MISIQYFNMRLDEERSSAHEYSGKTELLLCEILSNRFISAKQIVERSSWFIDMVYIHSSIF